MALHCLGLNKSLYTVNYGAGTLINSRETPQEPLGLSRGLLFWVFFLVQE